MAAQDEKHDCFCSNEVKNLLLREHKRHDLQNQMSCGLQRILDLLSVKEKMYKLMDNPTKHRCMDIIDNACFGHLMHYRDTFEIATGIDIQLSEGTRKYMNEIDTTASEEDVASSSRVFDFRKEE